MLARFRSFIAAKVDPKAAASAKSDSRSRELVKLESRLRDEKQKTEQLAKISYAKWKLRKEQEKEYALKYGVTLPFTSAQREQDDFFSTLEARLEQERLSYMESRKSLDFKGQEEERVKQERESAECVLKVLEEDLS